MDDYYEILGVDEDAPVDDIRTAYRDKKAAIDTSANDAAKSEVAALNKAWNVLSDPYQRGRYDQQRVDSDGADADDDDDDAEDSAPVRRPTRQTRQPRPAASDRAEKRRQARERALKPTITLPAGTQFPATRQRLIAMMIDLGVLLALVLVASFIVAPAVDKAVHKPIVDRIDLLRKELDKVTKQSDALSKTASDVSKKKGSTSADAVAAKKTSDAYAKRELKNAQDAFDKETKKLVPINISITGAALIIGLLYLVIPSARGGQTPGKKSQGIRVIRVDGSPLGFAWSFRRYGLILLTTFLLVFVTPFGALGAAVVLFAVTTWTRNANHQGVHDRLVKTVVVAAEGP
jgi:curved DNA-binding protein CbpA